MMRLIKRVLDAADQARGEAASEFLIALATRRLTLTDEHLRQVLVANPKTPPLVDALTTLANRALVEQISGITLDLRDDFWATPTGGYRMSSAKQWWPRMEGLPTTVVLHALASDSTEA